MCPNNLFYMWFFNWQINCLMRFLFGAQCLIECMSAFFGGSMNYRRGEKETVRYRSDRFFWSQQNWYIATREGKNLGPFPSRDGAQQAVESYKRILRDASSGDRLARKIALEGFSAAVLFGKKR